MPAVNLRFDAILFQQEAIRRLIAPWKQGKIDQTYIFAGQTSVGKRRTALAFAALLQCLEPPIGGDGLPEACGNCLSCRRIIGGTHPDVNFILPQGAEIRIDQVRQMQEMALLKPFLGKWRIFILDPAERLNEYSSNSLLKILEESPPRVLFILVTANLYRLLPTILSRATLVRFRTPTHEEARGVLQELSGRAAEEIAAWYGVSGGRFGLTLEWLSTGASLADFPALDLPGAQVAFLRALKGIPGRLEPPLQEAGSLEQALKVFSEADVASWPELCHARREFVRGLLRAPGLPEAFPLLFTGLLLGALDELKTDLKSVVDGLIRAQKGNYPTSILKEVEEGFSHAINETAAGQLHGFLEALAGWMGDVLHLLCEEGPRGPCCPGAADPVTPPCRPDPTFLLNLEAKEDIMDVARRWGMPRLRSRLAAVIRGLEQVRRYANPALVLENILSDIGGITS